MYLSTATLSTDLADLKSLLRYVSKQLRAETVTFGLQWNDLNFQSYEGQEEGSIACVRFLNIISRAQKNRLRCIHVQEQPETSLVLPGYGLNVPYNLRARLRGNSEDTRPPFNLQGMMWLGANCGLMPHLTIKVCLLALNKNTKYEDWMIGGAVTQKLLRRKQWPTMVEISSQLLGTIVIWYARVATVNIIRGNPSCAIYRALPANLEVRPLEKPEHQHTGEEYCSGKELEWMDKGF